nr:MAG TPA: hypothetical protein [Caudoviricetes sp.]
MRGSIQTEIHPKLSTTYSCESTTYGCKSSLCQNWKILDTGSSSILVPVDC